MHEFFMTLSIELMNNKATLCFDTRLRYEHLVEILFFSFYHDHQYLIERKNNKNNSLAWWIIFGEKAATQSREQWWFSTQPIVCRQNKIITARMERTQLKSFFCWATKNTPQNVVVSRVATLRKAGWISWVFQ